MVERQAVLNKKLNFFIREQISLRAVHFDILKEISDLYTKKSENNLKFDSLFSRLALKTNKDTWVSASDIHFSSVYKPDLDLEQGENLNQNILFLNKMYQPKEISESLLKKLKIRDNFILQLHPQINITEIATKHTPYVNLLWDSSVFRAERQRLLSLPRRYTDADIKRYTFLLNFVEVTYMEKAIVQKHNTQFWDFIKELNFDFTQKTSLSNYRKIYSELDNYIIYFIKHNEVTPNKNEEFCKSTALYSINLSNYVESSEVPLHDLTQIIVGNTNLEEILGIKQELSQAHCIALLSQAEIALTEEEVKKLDIINILHTYTVDDEGIDLKLPNRLYEWVAVSDLYHCEDNTRQIDEARLLHESFKTLARVFGVNVLSENNLVLKIAPNEPEKTNEIVDFFKERAKFIAFKINQTNWEELESDIMKAIECFDFYQVESVKKVWESINLEYSELDFVVENNEIYYTQKWKTNAELLDFLVHKITNGKNQLPETWLKNVITKWDISETTENLHDEFGEKVPKKWLDEIEVKVIEKIKAKENTEAKILVTKQEKEILQEIKDSGATMEEVYDFWKNNKKQSTNEILATTDSTLQIDAENEAQSVAEKNSGYTMEEILTNRTLQIAAESATEYERTKQNRGVPFNSGVEGEQFVYEDLCKEFPNSVKWTSSYGVDCEGYGTNEYDFEVYADETCSKILYYIDAKSSTLGEDIEKMEIEWRKSEWKFITKKDNLSYLIARVFNIGDKANTYIVYLKVSKFTL